MGTMMSLIMNYCLGIVMNGAAALRAKTMAQRKRVISQGQSLQSFRHTWTFACSKQHCQVSFAFCAKHTWRGFGSPHFTRMVTVRSEPLRSGCG